MLRLMLRAKSLNLNAKEPFVICYAKIFYRTFVQRQRDPLLRCNVMYNFAVIYFIFHNNITIKA